jgi:hypothetical protein
LDAKISVATFIDELRQELTYAVASGEEHALQFGLGEVAVALSVVVTLDRDGRMRLLVISEGSEYEGSSLHKITLNLVPVQAGFRSGEAIDTAGPVVIERKDVPQEVIERFAENPMDYR